ncbi:MAG: molybdopterin molybdotransferase MoeA [Planctomycetota bacterium]|nr:molybdopterin molybdotransferase MoeA [Planctomycetota bacterium]
MKFKYSCPDQAISELANHLAAVTELESRSVDENIYGRVLAESIVADRHSPAADVSAMDGYALNIKDLQTERDIQVEGESKAGSPAPKLEPHTAMKIFTGAIVPKCADIVIKKEDTVEGDSTILIRVNEKGYSEGGNIRKAGENARKGTIVLREGSSITGANAATIANFGHTEVQLIRPIKVSILTTGDEVGQLSQRDPNPWEIRNSNGNSLKVFFESFPWIRITHRQHSPDDRESIQKSISKSLDHSDAVIMTGGVSMGDYDHVPDVIRDMNANIIFHGLPIRPGKPILGASTKEGKLILGLPGNPVSAMVGCQRIGLPLLKYMAGFANWKQPPSAVRSAKCDKHSIPLHWFPLVYELPNGEIELCQTKGSGDLVALGKSSGFIEVSPNSDSEGTRSYYRWP